MPAGVIVIDGSTAFGLAGAAFGAGVLNAIAGGGTFLTLPALVFAGLPMVGANATSAAAVMPGYVGGAIGFWKEMLLIDRRRLVIMTIVTAVGGVAGAALLLITPDKAFKVLIPWLLLFATLLFAINARPKKPRVGVHSNSAMNANDTAPVRRAWHSAALGAVAAYGGYFNGGLGILLMAVLSAKRSLSLNTVNGLKNYLSALLSLISIVVFAYAGIVNWRVAAWMMGFSMLGGFVGARLAKRLPARMVYAIVVLTGLGMSAVFFGRL